MESRHRPAGNARADEPLNAILVLVFTDSHCRVTGALRLTYQVSAAPAERARGRRLAAKRQCASRVSSACRPTLATHTSNFADPRSSVSRHHESADASKIPRRSG